MSKLGSIELNANLVEKLEIGLWAIEIDEDVPPRMYVDETMLHLIGLDKQVSPEKTYHAWYDNVDPEHYEYVAAAVDKMSKGENAEVQYPWHDPKKGVIFVRCGGTRNYEYTKGIRLEGTHRDVTDMMHFQMQEQEKFHQMEVFSNYFLDTYVSAYYVSLDDYSCVPYKRTKDLEERFPIFDDYYVSVMEYIDSDVHPDDKDMLRSVIEPKNLKKRLKKEASYAVMFRDISGGIEKNYRLQMIRGADENHAAFGFIDITEELNKEMMNRETIERNFEIIEILASEYTSVYYIDLETDTLDPYTMNEETETTFGSVFRSGITYSEAFRLYVDKLIFPEDKPMMLKAGSVGNIMKELRNKKTFLTTYRDADGHYCEMKFVKVGNEDGTPVAVALGFANKDAELRAKEEEERIRQRNIDIIDILASEYSSVYYIDLTTDELDPYTMNEATESAFGQIFRSGIKYSEAFKLYVDTLVYEDDKKKMLRAGSIYNILRELSNKKTFSTTYRSDEADHPHYCEMKFVKVGDADNPQAVALGFADKDDEIRYKLSQEEKEERDRAVLGALSDDFGCVVYVDIDTASEIHYRFDPLFEKHIPGWSEINFFNERLDKLVEALVHPEDKKTFREGTRREVIKSALLKNNYYTINFRILIDSQVMYYQGKFVRDEHIPNHLVAGFHNVDSETKREMAALEKAERANRAKTDFLFNMSHDIRTPMNAIIGFTNMAIRDIDDKEKVATSLAKVQGSSEMLLSIINDILDMSRIESGKVAINTVVADLEKAFVAIRPMMEELALAKDINVAFAIKNVKNRYAYVDIPRTERILVNLVSNAVKYTLDGGWVTVTLTQISDPEDGIAIYRFVVADNGIGMSKEFVHRCFDEFAREENSTVSGIQGTGLGLSLAKALTELMNGNIYCESIQGNGSIFTIDIPFRVVEDDEANETFENIRAENKSSFAGRNVLLVEDNELNREIAADILREAGMIVTEAEDGRVAIEKVRVQGPNFYDFILMDIQMPFMNGYEASRRIRELYPTRHIPIIALSANAFEEDRQKSMDAGMDAHVAKPITSEILLKELRRFV